MKLYSEDLIDEFPSGEKTYLNNASTSLMPNVSISDMKEFLVQYNSIGPDSLESEPFVTEKLQSVRKQVSSLLNCQPDEIVLTQSTTDGVNIVANGINFKNDSNLIIRGGSHEHHANYYPWLQLSKKLNLRNLEIDENGFFDLEYLKKMIDEKTQLVSLSHALYNTGVILPIETIGVILRQNDVPFFVDAAQTVGCIGEMNVEHLGCDFMAFNGSKWLCGPMGTGLFYCKRSSSKLLHPTEVGGESTMIYNKTELSYKDLPDKFQTGFRNYVGMVGLSSSLQFMKKLGMKNIQQKNMRLAEILREELSKIPDIVLYGPENQDLRTSIVSFNLENKDPSYVVEKLEKLGFVLAVREIFDKKIVRASPHFFNTENEMLELVKKLKEL